MEEGVAGLLWPRSFGRYELVWPTDMSRYSHYIRPLAATDADAALTAVVIEPENAPFLAYQDALDKPRAKFTPEFKFYTWLDEANPVHRTLLRFSSGENIAFERVLSVLNTEMKGVVGLTGESLDEAVGVGQVGANSVLMLNGANNTYGQLPADVYFPPGSFSIEARVYVRDLRSWSRLIDFGNGPASDNLVFALSEGASGRPRLQSFRGGTDVGGLVSSIPLPLNQWVHLAATFDGTVARMYMDGVLVGQGPFNGPNQTIVRTNAFVGRSNWGDPLADADIDNLRIWNRSLSVGEVQEAADAVFPAGTSGLRAQFTFTKRENPATDNSGNNSHMTLHGTARTGVPGINILTAPRYVRSNVNVGDRILPPTGELGVAGGEYLAGYIVRSEGRSYNPEAYRDPFASGFSTANQGSIIPVNVLPNDNRLEVWWFRANANRAGLNTGNNLLGFRTIYWPSVVGRYTIQWPASPREIVLASKLGGTGLTPAEAGGVI